RTSGTAATAETAAVTSGPRIGPSTATPSAQIRGCAGSVPLSSRACSASLAIASGSARSTPARSTTQVTARYMAPVSRYAAPNRCANRRATVDLPEPDGPSIATTHRCATLAPLTRFPTISAHATPAPAPRHGTPNPATGPTPGTTGA